MTARDKKELYKSSLIILAVGLAVVLFAPAIGSAWANFYLSNLTYGGSMDSVDFLYMKQTTAQTCQIIGGIAAFLSGLQAVLVRVFFYDENTDAVKEAAKEDVTK